MKKVFFTGGSGLLALNWAAYCHGKFKAILGTNKRLINPDFASTISISGIQSSSSLQSIIGKTSVPASDPDPALTRCHRGRRQSGPISGGNAYNFCMLADSVI